VSLAVEGEMVPAVSVFLEKERIPPKLEIPEEEGALLLSGALFVLWYTWHLFFSAGWTGGISTFTFGPCRCAGVLIQKGRFVSTSATGIKVKSV